MCAVCAIVCTHIVARFYHYFIRWPLLLSLVFCDSALDIYTLSFRRTNGFSLIVSSQPAVFLFELDCCVYVVVVGGGGVSFFFLHSPQTQKMDTRIFRCRCAMCGRLPYVNTARKFMIKP